MLLSAAAVAWACTAQLPMSVKPGAAAPGTPVTVSGESARGPVELRWNGVDGPLVGRAADGSAFALGFKVPDVAPGVYTLVALARSSDGTVASKGTASFEVTTASSVAGVSQPVAAPSAQTASADLWSGYASADTGPGLATGTEAVGDVVGSRSGSPSLALGVGLLGFGLVALFAGFAVAELRRRKAVAPSSPTTR